MKIWVNTQNCDMEGRRCSVNKKGWSLPRCEEWLEDNEDNMKDRLTELGWEVMGALLMMEDDDE
jgi:hypothetical protein